MKKIVLAVVTLALSSTAFAQSNTTPLCRSYAGEGRVYSSEDRNSGYFKLLGTAPIAVGGEIEVVISEGTRDVEQVSRYEIVEISRSTTYRDGEVRIIGRFVDGMIPYAESEYVTIWAPVTRYYGQTQASMSFSTRINGNSTAGHVRMSCAD